MELNTANVKPSLVYSDADRKGDAGAFSPTDCPCPNLYKRLYPGQKWDPFLGKYVLEGPRFELLPTDMCYCATYRSNVGLGTVRDFATGTVPYGFQVGGRITLDFTGSGTAGGPVALEWVGGSLSSGDVAGLVGRNEHKYPKGWQLIVTGSDAVETGILPEGIADYYLSGEIPEGYNGFNRTTQNLPIKGRKPIELENEIVLDNTADDTYIYKDCAPALSFSSFSYANAGDQYNVSVHKCDAEGIATCGGAVNGENWKLKVIEDGVEFTRIRIGGQDYSDGAVLPVSAGVGTWSDYSVSIAVEVSNANQGNAYLSSLAYATFASGSGADELEGSYTSCGWASGLGGPDGTSQPYNCQNLKVGQCRLASQRYPSSISPIPPKYGTNWRGYPYSLIGSVSMQNSAAEGGTFVISGGVSALADDYHAVEFGGDVAFIMAGTYCNFDPNDNWNQDFITSGGAPSIPDTVAGEGYWFKKGERFRVWLPMSGTKEWTLQRMQTVNSDHSTLPRFTNISLYSDPTGFMVSGGLIHRQLGAKPPLPIGSDKDYSFSYFEYRSPSGSSIAIPKQTGVLINFGGGLSGEIPVNHASRPRDVTARLRTLRAGPAGLPPPFRSEALQEIPSEYPLPSFARSATYVQFNPTNSELLAHGSLGGAPADLPPWFSGDPVGTGAFTSWTDLATGTGNYATRNHLLGVGMYAYNGYSGVNQVYRGVEFLPYESTISNCERVAGPTNTFWCTGESFSLYLSPSATAITNSYATILSTEGNITQAGLVRGQREAGQALNFLGDSAIRDYDSFSGFESSAIAGKILSMQAATYGNYLGYVYHVPVALFLSPNDAVITAGAASTNLGDFPHYMLNGPGAGGAITNAWYPNADITESIQSALPVDAVFLTGISSYASYTNFLQDIPVSLCESGASSMSLSTNPSLCVAIGSFWAYDNLTGGLSFPGFTDHNPSTRLRNTTDEGATLSPLYNPLWGAE